jgi:hypothetical protein
MMGGAGCSTVFTENVKEHLNYEVTLPYLKIVLHLGSYCVVLVFSV